ncbi:MAG TPA: aldehyde dehydrogenase family protein, partial [Gemmataceae bacterium]|nr:aldehyde dehydrogenase family protein [Gemmataceae bacterium]
MSTATAELVPLLIAGRWQASRSERSGPVYNPSTGKMIARTPFCTAADVHAAVQAAAAALPAWAETPAVDRARVFFHYRDKLEQHADELARLVTREHGKTLAESRASVQRGIEMVEFACGIPSLLMGQVLPNIAANVDC